MGFAKELLESNTFPKTAKFLLLFVILEHHVFFNMFSLGPFYKKIIVIQNFNALGLYFSQAGEQESKLLKSNFCDFGGH